MTAPDLDALEKRLRDGSKQKITRYFGDLNGAIISHDALSEAADMIAELKEARAALEYIDQNKSIAPVWVQRRISAFLARNGKGEG